jgi:hypothetical protein
MGLFDYIVCEVPLPDGFTGELQSKDLDCYLLTHVITRDGRLLLEHLDRIDYELETRFTSRRDANFHGALNFYGDCGKREAGTYEWHEYNAKFVHGQPHPTPPSRSQSRPPPPVPSYLQIVELRCRDCMRCASLRSG